MFERYTEMARRCIFFARYEASAFGSEYIDTEHLLLGILREHRVLLNLPADAIRKEIEARIPRRERVATSIDIPVSPDVKSAFEHGEREADALQHKHIDCGHLVLGLLLVEKCLASEVLRKNGVDYESFRNLVSTRPVSEETATTRVLGPFGYEMDTESLENAVVIETAAASLDLVVNRLHDIVNTASRHLEYFSERHAARPRGRKRKELLGHLIDWAAAHHQWLARALNEPKLVASGYPQEDWLPSLHYQDVLWQDLVDAWISLSHLFVHLVAHVPEEKLNTPCRIGIADPIPLSELIANYVGHCDDLLGRILTRG
jgi:hypothetical protein